MAVTNFDVQPFSVLPGLNAINQGAETAFRRGQEEKKLAERRLQSQGLAKAIQSQDADAVFEFVANNPGSLEMAEQMTGFASDNTKNSMINTARNILLGNADPGTAMVEHATAVVNEGGDAAQSAAVAEESINNPEYGRKQAEMALALYDPESYKAYREATGGAQAEYSNVTETADGQKAGLNNATGQFEIIPSDGLDFKGEGAPTELGKLFDLQDSLPADDPRRAQVDAAIQKATGADAGSAIIPEALTVGLSEQVAAKGAAAFGAAGGGKDGIEAFVKVVDKATEQEQRVLMPKLLRDSFPSASPAEYREIEAAASAGKTVEAGLNSARNVRVEQRRLKKAKGFQDRAVQLLDKILASNQVGDVTGSLEGGIDFKFFSDAEAELIADIDEAQNILTADNMDLMTGVLSESDIKLLKNLSSGGLNRKRSQKRFRQDVQQMRNRLASQAVLTTDERAAASGQQPSQRLVFNPETGQLEPAR
tara:strand:+ start:10833 stop:12275 length:1443 start_codon:yes stop_codon:yes gene_type:complete